MGISICSFGVRQYYKFSGIFFKEDTVGSLNGFIFIQPCPYRPYLEEANLVEYIFLYLKINQKNVSFFFPKKVFQWILIRLKLPPCVPSLKLSIFNCLQTLATWCHGEGLWLCSASLPTPSLDAHWNRLSSHLHLRVEADWMSALLWAPYRRELQKTCWSPTQTVVGPCLTGGFFSINISALEEALLSQQGAEDKVQSCFSCRQFED